MNEAFTTGVGGAPKFLLRPFPARFTQLCVVIRTTESHMERRGKQFTALTFDSLDTCQTKRPPSCNPDRTQDWVCFNNINRIRGKLGEFKFRVDFKAQVESRYWKSKFESRPGP